MLPTLLIFLPLILAGRQFTNLAFDVSPHAVLSRIMPRHARLTGHRSSSGAFVLTPRSEWHGGN